MSLYSTAEVWNIAKHQVAEKGLDAVQNTAKNGCATQTMNNLRQEWQRHSCL
jgi:hypothetical protein